MDRSIGGPWRTFITVATALLFASWASYAGADNRIQFGIGANYAVVDSVIIGGGLLEPEPPFVPSTFSGVSPRATLSVRATPWLSVEGGWTRFASATNQARFPAPGCVGACPPDHPATVIDDVEQTGSAYWVVAVPTLQRDAWSWMVKLGAARTTVESLQVSSQFNRSSESNTGLLFGVGAAYQISPVFSVQLDVESLDQAASQIGLSLKFGF